MLSPAQQYLLQLYNDLPFPLLTASVLDYVWVEKNQFNARRIFVRLEEAMQSRLCAQRLVNHNCTYVPELSAKTWIFTPLFS